MEDLIVEENGWKQQVVEMANKLRIIIHGSYLTHGGEYIMEIEYRGEKISISLDWEDAWRADMINKEFSKIVLARS